MNSRGSNSSTSLSELDDDWIEKFSLCGDPKSNNRSDCYRIELSPDIASTSKTCADELGNLQIKLKPSEQLVTTVTERGKYILPFMLIQDEKVHDELTTVRGKKRRRKALKSVVFSSVTQEQPVTNHTREIVGETAVNQQETEIKTAKEYGVRRQPICCPISDCQELVSPGFYASHLRVDHSQVICCQLRPGQTDNFFLDPSVNQYGVIRCNVTIFLTDKLRDFGFGKCQNQLPILFLSTKLPWEEQVPELRGQYMYWFTGIASESLDTEYTLAIGSHQRQRGLVYSLAHPQSVEAVYQSGAGVIISQTQIDQQLRPKDSLLPVRLSFV
ncbi:uncharacterized protein LOC129725704 [Wyeomyia smithii]|uniref:uncharacterized protein LOC129725704 n=1 Tax=Wyeomyia smithii TaxID=174621 RepID=UPI002467CFBA|nr:uncharacterized protein LOC129725704 [Wyeomyia smithii]